MVVRDADHMRASLAESGDEPFMLARELSTWYGTHGFRLLPNAPETAAAGNRRPRQRVLQAQQRMGAASISAFPLFSGFVTKSMIMTAVAEEHLLVVWLMLLFASAGVFHHAGIKIPFFAFFAHDRGYRVEEAPLNMRLAMLVAASATLVWPVLPRWLVGAEPSE